jgi:threonine synthase
VAHGARVHAIGGPRHAATEAAVEFACEHDIVYGSHQWQPLFNLGTQTFAFELWEQLGRRVPDVVACPVGAGGMLLGAHLGFRALREAGLAQTEPRLVGVQSVACAPLARAVADGLDVSRPTEAGHSVAEGVLLGQPPRAREIIAAVRASGGTIVAVDDEALWEAHEELSSRGLLVELTSALPFAAISQLRTEELLRDAETIVVAVTGHGLKTATAVADRARG